MTKRNSTQTLIGTLLTTFAFLVLLAPVVLAQDQTEPLDQQSVSQANTAPPPAAKTGPNPGPFRKGKIRVGLYGGAGSTWNQTYIILGAGLGYYLVNGLEAGVDIEGWILQDPTFWKVTPQVRYVLWQISPIHPYVGAFWRQTYVSGDYADYDSWGGRLGIAYRKGGSYLALGAVYEKFNDYPFSSDDDIWYPEIAFWLSF